MTFGPFSLSDATAAEFNLNLWLQAEFNFDGACALFSVDNFNFNGTCYTGTTSGAFVPLTLDLAGGDAGNLWASQTSGWRCSSTLTAVLLFPRARMSTTCCFGNARRVSAPPNKTRR